MCSEGKLGGDLILKRTSMLEHLIKQEMRRIMPQASIMIKQEMRR